MTRRTKPPYPERKQDNKNIKNQTPSQVMKPLLNNFDTDTSPVGVAYMDAPQVSCNTGRFHFHWGLKSSERLTPLNKGQFL